MLRTAELIMHYLEHFMKFIIKSKMYLYLGLDEVYYLNARKCIFIDGLQTFKTLRILSLKSADTGARKCMVLYAITL